MKLVVNGTEVEVDDRHAKTPLLWVLRDVLGLDGTKFGCGAGFCAACTVLVDGHNTKACPPAKPRPNERWASPSPRSRVPLARSLTPFATRGTAATSCSAVTASPGRRSPQSLCSSQTRPPTTPRSTSG